VFRDARGGPGTWRHRAPARGGRGRRNPGRAPVAGRGSSTMDARPRRGCQVRPWRRAHHARLAAPEPPLLAGPGVWRGGLPRRAKVFRARITRPANARMAGGRLPRTRRGAGRRPPAPGNRRRRGHGGCPGTARPWLRHGPLPGLAGAVAAGPGVSPGRRGLISGPAPERGRSRGLACRRLCRAGFRVSSTSASMAWSPPFVLRGQFSPGVHVAWGAGMSSGMQRLRSPDGRVSFTVVGSDGLPAGPAGAFLAHLTGLHWAASRGSTLNFGSRTNVLPKPSRCSAWAPVLVQRL
jgi:hypothetical protein